MNFLQRFLGRGREKVEGIAPDQEEGELLINAPATVLVLPPLDFPHKLQSRFDFPDPVLAHLLNHIITAVLGRGNCEMTTLRYHLWRHVQRARHLVSFSIDTRDLPAVGRWALQANAVLIFPDSCIRAPDLTMLVTAAGTFNDKASLPYPPDAIARRVRTLRLLSDTKPTPPASMPPSLADVEAELRPASEVVARALGLLNVAAQGIAVGEDSESALPFMRLHNPEGFNFLTAKEKAFIEAKIPDAHVGIQMSWRFEALNVLLWALSIGPARLSPAAEPVDVNALSERVLKIAKDRNGPCIFELRPVSEILDMLDLTWRQHWIVRQANQSSMAAKSLNPSVVRERHYALNWLTNFQNYFGTDWDDIDTAT